MGLTHTQKRRVQRLRALEINEQIAEKKRDELLNRERPTVPTKIWREKRITGEDSRAIHDTVSDSIDDTTYDEDSENTKEILTDMDDNMVFVLPAEFCASED